MTEVKNVPQQTKFSKSYPFYCGYKLRKNLGKAPRKCNNL